MTRTWMNGASASLLTIAALSWSGTAIAQTTALHSRGVTSPGGTVQMGNNIWVADHVQGFCRLDPQSGGTFAINVATCNLSAVSPGQPTFDPTQNYVYVPDNSSKGQGVWRLKFNPTTNRIITISSNAQDRPTLLGANSFGRNRPTATTLDANGHLYVTTLKNGNVVKITNPHRPVSNQTVRVVARSSDGRGVSSVAMIGSDLYLTEGSGITVVSDVPSCTNASACTAGALGLSLIAPTAIASDGTDLYVADVNTRVYKYTFALDTLDVYASGSFSSISSLGFDRNNVNLLVGDDPTDGNAVGQGFIWQVTP